MASTVLGTSMTFPSAQLAVSSWRSWAISRILSSCLSTSLINSGSWFRASIISCRRLWKDILSADITSANMVSERICDVYAFVEATPISGPALMWTPQCDSRQMVDPTVLVMPTMRAPRLLQYRRAFKVSAVSPD